MDAGGAASPAGMGTFRTAHYHTGRDLEPESLQSVLQAGPSLPGGNSPQAPD